MSKLLVNRRLFTTGGAALAASTVYKPAIAQSKKDLVVATWAGYDQVARKLLIPDFEAKNNANVKIELGVGSTFIPKIIASPRRAPFDVVGVFEDEAILGQEANLWAPDQSAKMSNMGPVYDKLKPPNLPFYPQLVYDFPLVYNKETFATPTSWNDLWRADATIGVPSVQNSYGILFLYIAALLNGGNEDNLDPGYAAIKRLPKYKVFRGVVEGIQKFQRKEIDAALFYNHRGARLRDNGIDVGLARPKEGVWSITAGYQIARNSTEIELARDFINFCLEPDKGTAMAEYGYGPPNTKTVVPDETVKRFAVVYGEQQVSALRLVPWAKLNRQRDAIVEKWTREIAG